MTGTGSQFPLTRLAAKRNEMVQDGRILSNRDSIAALDRRTLELMERIDTNQAPNRLANLFKLWSKFRELESKDKKVEAMVLKKRIDEEFEKAYHDYMAWEQMFSIFDLRRKMVESEVKIAKDLHAILTAEDAYELIADIFSAILRIAGQFDLPAKVLKAFQYEFTRIVGDRPDYEDGSGSGHDVDSGGSG